MDHYMTNSMYQNIDTASFTCITSPIQAQILSNISTKMKSLIRSIQPSET